MATFARHWRRFGNTEIPVGLAGMLHPSWLAGIFCIRGLVMAELVTGPKHFARSGQRTLIVAGCEENDAAAMLVMRAFEEDACEELGLFVCVNETGFDSPGIHYWTPTLLLAACSVPVEWSLRNLKG